MQIILLSGGSGTRLWPLSNDARSKQFLKLLPAPDGGRESMVQRVVRQLREADIKADLTVATSQTQHDSVISQLGPQASVVTEPSRRDTFPAICLACEYLALEKGCPADETVVVMPCDPYTEPGYFKAIARMAEAVERGEADLMVMGIEPTYPSAKYGYVVPRREEGREVLTVERFTEKPDVPTAEKLIAQGAKWNGGVFAFRLGYMTDISRRFVSESDFASVRAAYGEFPKISFDYQVAERAESIGMVPFEGEWKDLGTWNTLTDELETLDYGNVTRDGTSENTHIFNETGLPLMCIGTSNLVIAASPDGILISEKAKSENIKEYAAKLKHRPMYEERRWGVYRVIDHTEAPDGFCTLTKRLTLEPGCSISYQKHTHRSEVWTFIGGEGEIVIGADRRPIGRGETVTIPAGTMHALKAKTPLTFIEIQTGSHLVEEDIERFPYDWD